MKKILFIAAIVSILIIVLVYLGQQDDVTVVKQIQKYDKDFNSTRALVGIPIINDSWIAHESDSSYTFWMNRRRKVISNEPMHLHKTSRFIGNRLIAEIDAFHYETKGDTAYRLLVEAYLDNNYKIDSLAFDFITYYKGNYPPTISKYLSAAEADSVLNQWGFANLYSSGK